MALLKKSLNDEIVQLGLLITAMSTIFLIHYAIAEISASHTSQEKVADTTPEKAVPPAEPARKVEAPPVQPAAPMTEPAAEQKFVRAESNTAAPVINSATIVVNKNGNTANSVPTINQAIAQAKPGDKIEIYPGTYKEDIFISKDLTLIGMSSSKDRIEVVLEGTQLLTISKGKVRVEGVRLENHENKIRASTLWVTGGEVSLSNVFVVSHPDNNPLYQEGGELTVENSSFSNGLSVLIGGGSFSCDRCKFMGQSDISVATGTEPKHHITVHLKDSQITDSGNTGIAFGGNSDGFIEKTEVLSAGKNGIYLSGTASVKIADSRFVGGKQAGIATGDNSRLKVSNSTIKGNLRSGLEAYEQSKIEVENSIVAENNNDGVYSDGKGMISGTKLEIRGNSMNGLRIGDTVSGEVVVLKESFFSDNRKAALDCKSDGQMHLVGTSANGNGDNKLKCGRL